MTLDKKGDGDGQTRRGGDRVCGRDERTRSNDRDRDKQDNN